MSESGIGSRPSRSQARAIFSRRAAHSSGSAMIVLYSSAKRAAGTTVPESALPPTISRGRGCPRSADGLDLLLAEECEPLRHRREEEAERLVLRLHPAGAHPGRDPAARDLVRRRRRVGQHRGRAERDRRDERPSRAAPFVPRGQRGRPRVERRTSSVGQRRMVVRTEERLDPVLLAGSRQRRPMFPVTPSHAIHGARRIQCILWRDEGRGLVFAGVGSGQHAAVASFLADALGVEVEQDGDVRGQVRERLVACRRPPRVRRAALGHAARLPRRRRRGRHGRARRPRDRPRRRAPVPGYSFPLPHFRAPDGRRFELLDRRPE